MAPDDSTSSSRTPAAVAPSDSESGRSAAPTVEFPEDFVRQMARQHLILEPAGDARPAVSSRDAIAAAISTYALFSESDPVVAGFFTVTMPRLGRLSNPSDPNSAIIAKYVDQPMWVVYARADVLKDETKPESGFVKGTVVVVLTSEGEPVRAMTF